MRPLQLVCILLEGFISIHAPREGCDAGAEGGKQVGVDISIHAPREGCDGMMIATTMQSARFQSTHPARGATEEAEAALRRGQDFNPRTPRGVRRRTLDSVRSSRRFQSTHPARGATCKLGGGRKMTPNISIHAPREGCDGQRVCIWGYPKDFNPRTPRGVRPSASRPAIIPFSISIHAPREGCDGLGAISPLYFTNFNPRTPRGVRRQEIASSSHIRTDFNPRTPRGVRLLWW